MELPHPVAPAISQENLKQNFVKVAYTQPEDSHWHFEIVVPKTTRLGPPPAALPVVGGDPVSLALFNRPEPACDIEVIGMHYPFDIHPADWLDFWLERRGITEVVSRKRIPSIAGTLGDCVARWKVNGASWAGRFFCTKVGPRLFLLWSRSLESHYPAMADDIFLAIMSLRIVNQTAGPLAEGIRWITAQMPSPWKLALPATWEPVFRPNTMQVASLDANLMFPAAPGVAPHLLAKLTMAIIAPGTVKDWNEVAAKTMEALREAGVQTAEEWKPDPAADPATPAWLLISDAILQDKPVSVHGIIHQRPHAWVAAVAIGPTRGQSPAHWMQCRRLVDIVTSTLQFGQA